MGSLAASFIGQRIATQQTLGVLFKLTHQAVKPADENAKVLRDEAEIGDRIGRRTFDDIGGRDDGLLAGFDTPADGGRDIFQFGQQLGNLGPYAHDLAIGIRAELGQ